MCGLTLAWVTSENSTSTGMPTSFDSIFFAGPYLVSYCLRSPVLTAPVRGSTPTLFAVQSPTACQLLFFSQLSFRVPLQLPDTARFQVQKSFVWFRAETDKGIVCSGHPYSLTSYHLSLSFITLGRSSKRYQMFPLKRFARPSTMLFSYVRAH